MSILLHLSEYRMLRLSVCYCVGVLGWNCLRL
jgi:hypothetical protein